MIGQLIFHSYFLYVLIDFEATQNFIAHDTIKRLGLEAIPLDSICIKLPNEKKITSDQMLLGVIVTLTRRDLTIDLIVFDMPYFDVILAMDFLCQCKVKIDYKKKKVRFHLDNG